MSQEIGANYAEVYLFPPSIEDWVEADQPARVYGCAGSGAVGIWPAEERSGAAELRGGLAVEGMVIRVSGADTEHAGVGAGVPGARVVVVAEGAVKAESDNAQLVPMLEEVQANLGAVAQVVGQPLDRNWGRLAKDWPRVVIRSITPVPI